jgi:hypothetical protein
MMRFLLMFLILAVVAVAAEEPAEEIYVFRTSRTEATAGATSFCAPAPFMPVREDFYALASIELDTRTSKVANENVRPVGGFRACFTGFSAPAPDQARRLQMFAKGDVAGVTWTGSGDCIVMASQPPVMTVLAVNCQLALSDLPEGYAGGFLVSSTVAPVLGANAPPDAHVPGYLSTSVVTVRLWRKVK